MNAIEEVIKHIESLTFKALPESTVEACKTFVLDSVGVGLSGSRVARTAQVKSAVTGWGQGDQAHVWVTGEPLPASSAAAINGYQIHNQEWDCVHEAAVVHPMATILSALMAYGEQHQVSGKQLILGLVVAVDVATLIGGSATSGLKFFRPSVCGCLGATAGMCAMLGIKGEVLANALGIAYSQISGTMQAHVEGSPMLAMQIGLNSRAAVQAVDLARAGFSGPKDILEGPFGYLNLFEDEYDLSVMERSLGKNFQIEQVSHKPFPTGRAAHGTVDGILSLQLQHHFTAEDIHKVDVYGTPLINRLVNRPIKSDMDASYGKLCNGYVAATALLTGKVTALDFEPAMLADPRRLELGKKVHTHLNQCTDPNALAPIQVCVYLKDGSEHKIDLPAVLGHPDRPFKREAQLEKFHAACASAVSPFSDSQISKLINAIDDLQEIPNITQLVDLMINTNHKRAEDE